MRTPALALPCWSALALIGLAACDSPPRAGGGAGAASAVELFELHCSACHGSDGAGDGPAVPWLFPPPRDFTQGRFRMVSSVQGGPDFSDVLDVLRRGMPGSAMPSFAWMGEAELEALAAHVLELVENGLVRRRLDEAARLGAALAPDEARREARRAFAPGEPVIAPSDVAIDADLLERGEAVYLARCAACHGADGRAEDDTPQWTAEGDFGWARDFTAGVLKGGATREALARRILCGMPGTTMPAHRFEDERDLQALLAHLSTLIPRQADQRLVQRRHTLPAPRGGEWGAAATHLVLAPMVWSRARVVDLHVRARHDGQRLELQLGWEDAERDVGEFALHGAVDGAAVAFSAEERPPLVGMGARGHALDLWHWRANLWTDRAGVLDLLERPPHARGDPQAGSERSDAVPRYLPARPVDAPTDEVAALRAEGGAPAPGDGTELSAQAIWSEGRWRVVLSGPLDPAWLAAGRVQVAFAIWNAAVPGSLASKSVTIWHELALAD
jgi:DMSO reductase family type II enzyme heme b subunit